MTLRYTQHSGSLETQLLRQRQYAKRANEDILAMSSQPLFFLARDILCLVLNSWVDLKSVCRLDSATCATELRNSLLATFSDEFFICDSIMPIRVDFVCQQEGCLEWLARRKVKVRDWYLGFNFAPNKLLDLLTVTGGAHVRSLELRNLGGGATSTTLLTISFYCQNVSKIKMVKCENWYWALTSLTREAQSSLEEVILEDCDIGKPLTSSGLSLPNLRRVMVQDPEGPEEYSSKALAGLLTVAPNLIDLRLGEAAVSALHSRLNEPIVRERMRALHTLVLDPVYVMPVQAMTTFSSACCELRRLHLFESDDAVIRGFLDHCQRISCLGIAGPTTGAVVPDIAMSLGTQLLYLFLQDVAFSSEEQIGALAEHCTNLQELELSDCTGVTPDSLTRLISTLSCLTELQLDQCSAVTDAVLLAIAKHLPDLTLLSLRECTGFTSSGAHALVSHLQRLEKFGVDGTVFNSLVMKMWKERLPSLAEDVSWPDLTHFTDLFG